MVPSKPENTKKTPEDIMFYTETLKLIKIYLQTISFKNSSESLQNFIKLLNKSNINIETGDAIDLSSIECCEVDNIKKEHIKNISSMNIGFRIVKTPNINQKILFLNELRILILTALQIVNQTTKARLQRYHLYLHLLELSLDNQKSKSQKIIEFLNANFALDSDDIIGHAIRGNYGTVIDIAPEYSIAIEEIRNKSLSREEIKILKKKYKIPDLIIEIITGNYKDFKNSLEKDNYFVFHELEDSVSSPLLKIFDGDNSLLANQDDCFIKLMFLLTNPVNDLRIFENQFEKLFFETFYSDPFLGLEFLAFSRKCSFYFEYLIAEIPLNNITTESLIRFAIKNELNKDILIDKYAYILQDRNDYEQLCKFILNYKIVSFDFKKESLEYFIDHFDNIKLFIPNEMLNSETMVFLKNLNEISTVEESITLEIFCSKYFLWFIDRIFDSLLKRENIEEKTIFKLINILYEYETQKGIILKEYKTILAKLLIK